MNRYTLEVDGRRLTLEAPDEATATRFATEWARQNPAMPVAPPAPSQDVQGPPMPPDNRSWARRFGEAADDMVRIGANAVTLGGADRLAGWMSGRGHNAEKALTEQARDRAGFAAYAGDAIGGILPAAGAMRAGGAAISAVAPQLAARAGLGATTAGMAGVGAGLGATEAAIKNENVGVGALTGAAGGAIGNVAGEAIARGVGRVAGAFNPRVAVPSVDDLRNAQRAAYQAADDAGAVFSPAAARTIYDRAQKQFVEMGATPALQPRAFAALDEVAKAADSNVTLKGLETLRRVAQNAYELGNNTSNALSRQLATAIEDVQASPPVGAILAGDASRGAAALKEAREVSSRLFKQERISDAVERAGLRASSTGTGGNVDNATRQNILREMLNGRGWTPDEQAALRAVVEGTPTQNALRLAGRLSPQGNGLMASLNVGAAAYNPMALFGTAAAYGAKRMADRMTERNIDALERIILAGGSRAATEAPPNAVQRLARDKSDRLKQLLLGGGLAAIPGVTVAP